MRNFDRLLRRVYLTRRGAVITGMMASLSLVAGILFPSPVAATPLVDDYPSYLKAQPRDALVDPWSFYSRECVSFVAWRLRNDNGIPFSNSWGGVHWGNAYEWGAAARALGFPIDGRPTVGSVAWWDRSKSRFGHVAWVARTYSDGSVLIEEYNYVAVGAYSQRRLYPGSWNWPSGFLHLSKPAVANTSAPKITKTPVVGSPITVSRGTWSPTNTSFKYAWFANNVQIKGATSASYTPTIAQLGKTLKVQVTASAAGAKSKTVSTAASAPIVAGTLTGTGAPKIVGTPRVGMPLVAQGATWKPASAMTYQWLADGVAISHATSTSYTPQLGDLGKAISVKVTATASGYKTASQTTKPTAEVAPGIFKVSEYPSVVGTPVVGSPITALPGNWSPDASYSYQWFVGTSMMKGATQQWYTPVPADVGKLLWVEVTGSASGFTSRSETSPVTVQVAPGTFTADPLTTLGAPVVGVPLSINPGTVSGTTQPTITYQWMLNGKPIAGARTTKYTPKPSDLDKRISVAVSAAAPGYHVLTRTTPLSIGVAPGALKVTRKPTMSLTPSWHVPVNYTSAEWSMKPSKVTYQWYANGKPISRATAATLIPQEGTVGTHLSVTERVSLPGYRDATVTVTSPNMVKGGRAGLSSSPSIKGSPVVGSEYTLTAGGPVPSSASRTVQWLRDGAPIARAAGWKYRLTAADVGHRISAQVTVARSMWTTNKYRSGPTSLIRKAGERR